MPIKVMVIDDSALVRKLMTDAILSEPNIEVISAMNPIFAMDKISRGEKPDVITLDIEMPQMDGITFLEKIVRDYKIPTIMVSSLTEKGADITLEALQKGAFDFVTKPKSNLSESLQEIKEILLPKIKAAYEYSQKIKNRTSIHETKSNPLQPLNQKSNKIIAIGSSTGGTQALESIITKLPENFPPILIVQHMPPKFTLNFANRLNQLSQVKVKEAENNDRIENGTVYIAPGDYHLELKTKDTLQITQSDKMNRHRPSVDVLFQSCAKILGKDAIGVILTGMGNDGAVGMKTLKEKGAYTIAQSEETCIVFGMPKEAIKLGAVQSIIPLDKIPNELMRVI